MVIRFIGGPADGQLLATPHHCRSFMIPVQGADGLGAAEYRPHRELGAPWFEYWGTREIEPRDSIPDA